MTVNHRPYEALACAVLNRAAMDVRVGNQSWDEALRFLTCRSHMLTFWCDVAGLDVNAIIAGARQRFARQYAVLRAHECMVSHRPTA